MPRWWVKCWQKGFKLLKISNFFEKKNWDKILVLVVHWDRRFQSDFFGAMTFGQLAISSTGTKLFSLKQGLSA